MNQAQERHVKAMARKIWGQAESIQRRMSAIESHNLSDMPVNLIAANFEEVTMGCANMQRVLDDMLPNLPS